MLNGREDEGSTPSPPTNLTKEIMITKMTIIVLLLAGGQASRHFIAHEDLSRFNGVSLSISAQGTEAEARRQDEFFSRFYRYDPTLNLNVPAFVERGEYHGLPESAIVGDYNVIYVRE